MLARLQDELGERKRLVTELELLKETKFNLENENSSLQRTLDNIDEKIKSATSVIIFCILIQYSCVNAPVNLGDVSVDKGSRFISSARST